MRVAILALFLCAGPAAFCQPAASSAASPDKQVLSPPGGLEPERDFTKGPAEWHIKGVVPMKPGVAAQRDEAQIDTGMIVHPPESSIGVQAAGTLVAQNLYPGLRLLPIGESKVKAQAIPTVWPSLKIEQIPTVWPQCVVLPLESGAQGKAAGK